MHWIARDSFRSLCPLLGHKQTLRVCKKAHHQILNSVSWIELEASASVEVGIRIGIEAKAMLEQARSTMRAEKAKSRGLEEIRGSRSEPKAARNRRKESLRFERRKQRWRRVWYAREESFSLHRALPASITTQLNSTQTKPNQSKPN